MQMLMRFNGFIAGSPVAPQLIGPLSRRLVCKSLFNFTTWSSISDFLLSELDVVPQDRRYLKLISKEEFSTMDQSLYIRVTSSKNNYRRLATILPLYADTGCGELVVPIPCIIDTGAPATLVLGTGALNQLKLLELLHGDIRMVLRGLIKKNNKEIKNPVVNILPGHFESNLTVEDVRYNILGIHGLQELGYVIDFGLSRMSEDQDENTTRLTT